MGPSGMVKKNFEPYQLYEELFFINVIFLYFYYDNNMLLKIF